MSSPRVTSFYCAPRCHKDDLRLIRFSGHFLNDKCVSRMSPFAREDRGDMVETADDSAVEVVGSAWDRHTWRRELDPP